MVQQFEDPNAYLKRPHPESIAEQHKQTQYQIMHNVVSLKRQRANLNESSVISRKS